MQQKQPLCVWCVPARGERTNHRKFGKPAKGAAAHLLARGLVRRALPCVRALHARRVPSARVQLHSQLCAQAHTFYGRQTRKEDKVFSLFFGPFPRERAGAAARKLLLSGC